MLLPFGLRPHSSSTLRKTLLNPYSHNPWYRNWGQPNLTSLTLVERPRENHSALFRVYDFAGEHGLPVSIHHNIAPIAHDGKDHGTRYLREILDAFQTFPKTTFIWCHAGISRRIVVDDSVPMHDQILARHGDHVFVDLSWVVFEDYMVLQDEERHVLYDDDGDARIRQEWVNLVEKYPDNFLLGSDIIADFRKYHAEIREYNALLKRLKPEARVKVGDENFIRVMPKKGMSLPAGYVYPEKRFTRYQGPLEEAPKGPRQ